MPADERFVTRAYQPGDETAILDLCNDQTITLTPADVAFDQGDVYMTDWLHRTVDITAVKPSYEPPIVPTRPFDSGTCFTSQSIVS